MRAVLAVLVVTGCLPASETLPPGYPPQIGTVTADLNGTAQNWGTYDYSLGALDAAVQITSYDRIEFHLMGDPAGKPGGDANRLMIKGVIRTGTMVSALGEPVIEIIAGAAFDGPRLTSVGAPVTVVLDTRTPIAANNYGHVTGHFTATLCAATGEPARIDRTACQQFSGTFSSDMQISGT